MYKDAIGKLVGKTTTHTFQMLILDPKVERNNYFAESNNKKNRSKTPLYFLI